MIEQYCSENHNILIPERSFIHPAIAMSRARAIAWTEQATDVQFYDYIDRLANIYAKRHYTGNGVIDSTMLFRDYKKWSEDGKITGLATDGADGS